MAIVSSGREFHKWYFCGIDLHDRKMMVVTAQGRGKERYKEYDTSSGGVEDLIDDLKRMRIESDGPGVWVAHEASGCGPLLAEMLMGEGFLVSVLSPSHLPTSQKTRSSKTDKRDAKRVLDVLRGHALAGGDLPEVNLADPELRDHRELVRRRIRISEELTRVKNMIHGLLKRNGIRKERELKNWTNLHLAWLEKVAEDVGGYTGYALRSLLRELWFYEGELKEADRLLKELSRHERYLCAYERMISIKGVGLHTAMTFLVELGDPRRFPNRRCLASYLGLSPRSYESGENDDRKGHISKMGPSRVRKLLNQAAWIMVITDSYWSDWYHSRVHTKKDSKRMIVAVMRKLAIILWHEAKDGMEEAGISSPCHNRSSSPASRVSVTA